MPYLLLSSAIIIIAYLVSFLGTQTQQTLLAHGGTSLSGEHLPGGQLAHVVTVERPARVYCLLVGMPHVFCHAFCPHKLVRATDTVWYGIVPQARHLCLL